MTQSDNLKILLAASNIATFENDLMSSFVKDAKDRNPDVTNEKMLQQLARPKYNDAVKAINAELESLKIINRRKAK